MAYHRHVTPPSASIHVHDYDAHLRPVGIPSTKTSYLRQSLSPINHGRAATSIITPPRSPPRSRDIGPTLLPRLRNQDQVIDYNVYPIGVPSRHLRTTSLPPQGYQVQSWTHLPPAPQNYSSRATAYTGSHLLTPPSAAAYELLSTEPAAIGAPSYASRSRSTSIRGHSRTSSTASIDPSTLARHGYPTYRNSPAPQPAHTGSTAGMMHSSSAMSHLAPIALPDGHIPNCPARRRTVSPPAQRVSRLSQELEYDYQLQAAEQSSILEYLTSSNPTPSLTRHYNEPNRCNSKYFWFDVRNVRSWTDFNIETISSIPQLLDLLRVKVPAHRLPAPARVNPNPESHASLAHLCSTHHAVKVNAALKVSLGKYSPIMRSCVPSSSGRHQQPEFVANLPDDIDSTTDGERRGRVVGIVKCYEQWNSGQRNMSGSDKVRYLQGLAQLQYFMRQHGTRYGFIMTEIELVCVRAGGPTTGPTSFPLFGYLEVAASVPINVHGTDRYGDLQMTADLALWYLHMLAKEISFDGQMHWRMEVGAPAALSRKNHTQRDTWIAAMAKPMSVELRQAKKNRGWVWPDEPLNRREHNNTRRSRRSAV